uniref:Uncharacterized protein n=1 Tax=Morchella brunnea TaxID=1174671 RepID=A0A8K1I7E5_9PEZI|nr:hypothetical protein LK370_mgp143 [Morchella brunnea]UBU98442.1 hypothetical protein [Morchella brunnea]
MDGWRGGGLGKGASPCGAGETHPSARSARADALKINSRQSNNLNNIYISPSASPSHFASSSAKGFNKKLNLNQRRNYSTNNYKPEKIYGNADTQKQKNLSRKQRQIWGLSLNKFDKWKKSI